LWDWKGKLGRLKVRSKVETEMSESGDEGCVLHIMSRGHDLLPVPWSSRSPTRRR
jgi:hypothetical protein